MSACENGLEHKRDEWCNFVNLSSEELNTLTSLVEKMTHSCHIPHSMAHISAAECPSCAAEDFLKTKDWWQPKRDKYCAFIGRWQSPHQGHRWLINQWLNRGEKVLILIRDVKVDEKNPFTADEVHEMLSVAFTKEILKGNVALQIIPDIKSVNYGRGVGYDVNCFESKCPEEIKRISATEIRRQIRAGEDGWRSMVMDGVEGFLEEKLSESKG